LPRPHEETADEAITRRIQEMKAESGLSTRPPVGTPANEIQGRFPKAEEEFDRSFLDRAMGSKITLPTVEGEGTVSIKVAPKEMGTAPDNLFRKDTVERQSNMEDSKKGPEVTVTSGNEDTGAGENMEAD
jgi:hypothetical protein